VENTDRKRKRAPDVRPQKETLPMRHAKKFNTQRARKLHMGNGFLNEPIEVMMPAEFFLSVIKDVIAANQPRTTDGMVKRVQRSSRVFCPISHFTVFPFALLF
jgi:hypothetical protein